MVLYTRKRKSSTTWVRRNTKKPKYTGKGKAVPVRFKAYSKLRGGKLFRMTKRKFKNQQLGIPRSLKSIGSKISRDGITTAKATVSMLNCQRNNAPQKFNPVYATQQYQLVLSETIQLASAVQQQAHLIDTHMDNWHYDSSAVGIEMPMIWQVLKNQIRSGNDTTLGQPQVLLLEELRKQLLYLKSHTCEYTIVNTSTGPVTLTIYEIRLKVDGYETPDVAWERGLAEDDNNGGALYNAGAGQYNTARTIYNPGCKPMESPDFRRRNYITHQRTITIEPGQMHYHTVQQNFNRIVEWADLYTSTGQMALGTNKYMAEFTRFTMFSILGAPGETAGVNGKIGYAPGQINIFSDKVTKFYGYQRKQVQKFYKNLLDMTILEADMRQVEEDGDVANISRL